MNTLATSARWRQVAAAAGIVIAAMSGSAALADAKPKLPPGASLSDQWVWCMQDAREVWGRVGAGAPFSGPIFLQSLESCCTDLGGIFNNGNWDCYLPDGETVRPQSSPSAPGQQAPGDLPLSPGDKGPATPVFPTVPPVNSPPASGR
jgi:hypothetical protein